MHEQLIIQNPKRHFSKYSNRENWLPYYAGFSEEFARNLLLSAKLDRDCLVMDPWNGSGTTTSVASELNIPAVGFDLNPVSVIAARAKLIPTRFRSNLLLLCSEIIKYSHSKKKVTPSTADPLCTWIVPKSVGYIRSLENAIRYLASNQKNKHGFNLPDNSLDFPPETGFFYLALFKTVRALLGRYQTTNPTWIKEPENKHKRIRPYPLTVSEIFSSHVKNMCQTMIYEKRDKIELVKIRIASSEKLPVKENSIDLVLSSPPYCTRIDYAIATKVELAVLGYSQSNGFDKLRKQLIGSTTVPKRAAEPSKSWGDTCVNFLDKLSAHGSKASDTYYLKNHLQYFDAIYRSLSEISRTLKSRAQCILVVQDSYYKDIHNDLTKIIIDMSANVGMHLFNRVDYSNKRNMVKINSRSRKYNKKSSRTESVICLIRGNF